MRNYDAVWNAAENLNLRKRRREFNHRIFYVAHINEIISERLMKHYFLRN